LKRIYVCGTSVRWVGLQTSLEIGLRDITVATVETTIANCIYRKYKMMAYTGAVL
jgi:hypothetical protein